MDCSTPGLPVHHQLPEFTQTHVHWVCDAIQPSHPLSSPSPSTFNLYQHQGLFSEPVLCIRWPKYWIFSFSISPSNEYSGLISFRMDWLNLLAVHGTLKSLLQHLSSKASILWHSAFFIVQLSHPYMTTGKAWRQEDVVQGDDRGWDGWMASPTQWTWVWVNARSWWWTGRPGVLQPMDLQSRTRLSNWIEWNWKILLFLFHNVNCISNFSL